MFWLSREQVHRGHQQFKLTPRHLATVPPPMTGVVQSLSLLHFSADTAIKELTISAIYGDTCDAS